jgi:hypothetical protein
MKAIGSATFQTSFKIWHCRLPQASMVAENLPFSIHFANGSTAIALLVNAYRQLDSLPRALGLSGSRPVIVVIGGASQLSEWDAERLRSLFRRVLAPLAEAVGACVVDGGTDAGVMRMMGEARAQTGSSFPLIGVVPEGVAILPDRALLPDRITPATDAVALEPHHTHFVFIPGSVWGDESPWLAKIASVLADNAPSVSVLINGGEITWGDATESVDAGRSILVIAGSGRTANELATAVRGGVANDRAKELMASGLLSAIDLGDFDKLTKELKSILLVE